MSELVTPTPASQYLLRLVSLSKLAIMACLFEGREKKVREPTRSCNGPTLLYYHLEAINIIRLIFLSLELVLDIGTQGFNQGHIHIINPVFCWLNPLVKLKQFQH